jgi:hypothetical protein
MVQLEFDFKPKKEKGWPHGEIEELFGLPVFKEGCFDTPKGNNVFAGTPVHPNNFDYYICASGIPTKSPIYTSQSTYTFSDIITHYGIQLRMTQQYIDAHPTGTDAYNLALYWLEKHMPAEFDLSEVEIEPHTCKDYLAVDVNIISKQYHPSLVGMPEGAQFNRITLHTGKL